MEEIKVLGKFLNREKSSLKFFMLVLHSVIFDRRGKGSTLLNLGQFFGMSKIFSISSETFRSEPVFPKE